MKREVITSEAMPGIAVAVDVPAEWEARAGSATPTFVALMPQQSAGPFRDNLTVDIAPVPDEMPAQLEAVQAVARAQALETVPDYHLVDDRPLDLGDLRVWFRAAVFSAPPSLSVAVRQLIAVEEGALITIALTSFPFRDDEASELFERIAGSLEIRSAEGEG